MSFTNLKYHIVFSVKERRPLITDELRPRLVQYVGGIVRNLKGVLVEANGSADHLHIAAGIHPTTSVSDFLRTIKCNSTDWIHREFRDLAAFRWQDEYSAFTVSQSQLPAVVGYVQGQGEHHRTMAFEQELRLLLEKHGISFDERYLFG